MKYMEIDNRADPRLRSNNFDILRMVFAGMVVLFHIAFVSQVSDLHWLTFISSTFAVQAFFFVSGFLVTMSCERTSTVQRYFEKRFRRILPAYFVVIFASAIALSPLSELNLFDYFSSNEFFRYLGFNSVLSNFTAPTLPAVFANNPDQSVNGSLWTIKIEVAFYCLVPVLTFLGKRVGYFRILLSVFILSLVWRVGFQALAELNSSDFYAKLAKQLPGQLSYFAGGALAYYRTREGKNSPPLWLALLSIVVYWYFNGLIYWIFAPFAVTVIVYWAAMSAPKLWSPAKYGDFSYGLYLYHFPIAQTFVALKLFDSHPWISLVVVILSAFAASVFSWFFVEKRFLTSHS